MASMNGLTIVTGGAGFIGSHLVERLVASGQRVRVVERPGADVGHLPPGVEVVWADIRDRETLARALRGGRRVYHLAANPNLWARDRRGVRGGQPPGHGQRARRRARRPGPSGCCTPAPRAS